MYKLDWVLDLEKYFNFWKICDEEKIQLASNKLDNEAEEWWEDIQIDKKRRDKHPICSRQRMKKLLIDLWVPNDFYDVLDYISVDYKSIYSDEKHVQNMKFQPQNQIKLSQSGPCAKKRKGLEG